MACYREQPEVNEVGRTTLRMCDKCLGTSFVPVPIADLENYECDECQDATAE